MREGPAVNVPTPEVCRDADLVEAARAGSTHDFGKLLEKYYSLVCSVAYALTGSLSQSEEVAQETFIAAWSSLSKLRRPDQFRSWVCGIARNLSHHSVRDELDALPVGRSPLSVGVDRPSAEPSPLERAISQEEEFFLWQELGRIPESYRMPLVLFYREQQSIEEIAAILAISEKSVKTRLWRGRRVLAENTAAAFEATLVRSRARITKAVAAGMLAALPASPRAAEARTGWTPSVSPGVKRLTGKAWLLGVTAAMLSTALVANHLWSARGYGRPTTSKPSTATRPTDHSGAPIWALAIPAAGSRQSPTNEPFADGPRVVLSFDFEEAVLPPDFRAGEIVPCPAGSTGGRCAAGSVGCLEAAPKTLVDYQPGARGPAYARTLVISFDFWAGAGREPIEVEIGMGPTPVGGKSLPRAALFYMKDVVRGAWTHVDLRTADFIPWYEAAPLEPGEPLTYLQFAGSSAGGAALFIDNVRIVDYGAAPLPSVSSIANVYGTRRL